MSDSERHEVYHFLLENTNDGKLRHGAIRDAMEKFGVSRKVVYTILSRVRKATTPEEVMGAINRRNKGNSGRTRISTEDIQTKVQNVPLRFRSTLTSMANKTDISTSTLARSVKRGVVKRYSNAVKPQLTETATR